MVGPCRAGVVHDSLRRLSTTSREPAAVAYRRLRQYTDEAKDAYSVSNVLKPGFVRVAHTAGGPQALELLLCSTRSVAVRRAPLDGRPSTVDGNGCLLWAAAISESLLSGTVQSSASLMLIVLLRVITGLKKQIFETNNQNKSLKLYWLNVQVQGLRAQHHTHVHAYTLFLAVMAQKNK